MTTRMSAPKGMPTGDATMLFALSPTCRPEVELCWAADLARMLRTDLHVLCIVDDLDAGATFRAPQSHGRARRAAQRATALCREVRDWCAATMHEWWSDARFHIRVGPSAREIAFQSTELGTAVVAIPQGLPGGARTASLLLRGPRIPVLVIGDRHRGKHTIVAATDLEDDRVPILRMGAELAQRTHARLLFVHNLAPPPPANAAALASARLRQHSRRLAPSASAVVSARVNVADAIIEVCEAASASLVIVGTRERTWLEELSQGASTVANRLVRDSGTSVLVLPLRGAN
jgi:nucleotide-binding universal stress UspA family protein